MSQVTGRLKISPFCLLWKLTRDPLDFLMRLHRRHGTFVVMKVGLKRVYSVIEPELIRQVLVTQGSCFAKGRGLELAKAVVGEGILTSHGDFHRRQRRLIQPLFQRNRLEHYGQVMVETTREHLSTWRHGKGCDLAAEMTDLSVEIVTRTLFGRSLGGDRELFLEALHLAVERFQVGLIPIMGLLEKLPLPSNRRFRLAVERLDRVVLRLIQERRQAPPGPDMLYQLMSAEDEGRSMSDRQLRDEVMTLFLAGHETTASALAWTMALLGAHPEWLTRGCQEVDQVLGQRPPSLGDLSALPVCQGIWLESMRVFPPAWMIGRRSLETVDLGGECLPSGSIIILPQWVTQRQVAYFAQPERFCPERWQGPPPPRFAYFPFGGGARVCIGEQFARVEGVLVLASLLQNWTFQTLQAGLPKPIPRVTLQPKGGVWARLLSRRA